MPAISYALASLETIFDTDQIRYRLVVTPEKKASGDLSEVGVARA